MAEETRRKNADASRSLKVEDEQRDRAAADPERFSAVLLDAGPADIDTEPVLDLRRRLLAAARA